MALASKVGANIRTWRETRGLSQAALGRAAGCSHVHIANIERGDSSPTVEMLERIASALKVHMYQLIGEEVDAGAMSPDVARLMSDVGRLVNTFQSFPAVDEEATSLEPEEVEAVA